jgi:hypothetical protein
MRHLVVGGVLVLPAALAVFEDDVVVVVLAPAAAVYVVGRFHPHAGFGHVGHAEHDHARALKKTATINKVH